METQQLVDTISKLTLKQAADLAAELKKALGLEGISFGGGGGGGAAPAAAAAPVEEKTTPSSEARFAAPSKSNEVASSSSAGPSKVARGGRGMDSSQVS